MAVEYRNMRIEDEDEVYGLWQRTWGARNIEQVRSRSRLDPRFLDHIFIAIDEGGKVLSTARYAVRHIRDANALPRPAGCVASVVTVEEARRQGHAREVVRLALESMRSEGCAWTLLFSSSMGQSLYEGLGYRTYSAPYFRGTPSGQLAPPGNYTIECLTSPFDISDDAWTAIRVIYKEYNKRRPLSLIRDEEYWQGRVAMRLASGDGTYTPFLFLARNANNIPVGYLLVYFSTQQTAREEFNLDQHLAINELGLAESHEGALDSLLSAALDRAEPGAIGVTCLLPREQRLEQAMSIIFGDSLQILDDRRMMARPLGETFSEGDISAMFEAPGAHFWSMDDF